MILVLLSHAVIGKEVKDIREKSHTDEEEKTKVEEELKKEQ
jgi:hypothetical protein